MSELGFALRFELNGCKIKGSTTQICRSPTVPTVRLHCLRNTLTALNKATCLELVFSVRHYSGSHVASQGSTKAPGTFEKFKETIVF